MLPGCCCPAIAINSPRVRVSRTASAKASAPAATSALYSPRLCPATKAGEGRSGRSVCSTRSAATLVVRMAGCALLVAVSVSAGPLKQRSAKPKSQDGVRLGEDGRRCGIPLRQRQPHADGL